MATAAAPATRMPLPATRPRHLSAPRIPARRLPAVRAATSVRVPPFIGPFKTVPIPPSFPTSPSGIVLVDPAEVHKIRRLKALYFEKVFPVLREEFAYKNVHQVPKIEKIVVNCGMGDAQKNSKGLEAAMKAMTIITGQRPVKTRAKKSISEFKIREGHILGMMVTLRGNIMYSFLDRLINVSFPRSSDFLGVNPYSFDGHGNFMTGLRDYTMFPEIQDDSKGKKMGMDVCIKTTAKTDTEAQRLLALLGMPFGDGRDPFQIMKESMRGPPLPRLSL